MKHVEVWIHKDGRNYVLTDSVGNTKQLNNADDLLDFLLIGSEDTTLVKFCWNLYEMFSVLQHYLPVETSNKLIKDDRAYYWNYKIFSSSGKILSITHPKHLHDNFYQPMEINVYGINKYFPDDSINSLNELKHKANELIATLSGLGWYPTKFSSAISIYDQSVLDNEYLPTIYTMPDKPEVDSMLEYCYKMMCREWRAIYKVGHFKDVYHYDLCGSYPSVIKDFYDTDDCTVKYSKTLQRCDWGIVKGTVNITSDHCPIVNKYGENVIGEYEDYFTTEQIGFLYHYKQGTFKMQDGFFLTFNNNIKPFNKIMTDLYAMRSKGGLTKTLSKSISVGIYGRMSEEYPEKYGKLFHPLYSVLTTSRVSILVGKFILENNLQDGLISVIVDGLMNTKQVQCPNDGSFGSWRSEQVNALVLSIGHQYFSNKKDSYLNIYEKMIESIIQSPNKIIYNNVLLNKNMMNTNRHFKNFPRNGGDILNNTYKSDAIRV